MKNKIFILLLLIISSITIFYKYDKIPKGLAHDENELARVAFSLENRPFTPFTTIADGHGTPYFYTLLTSFKIFGVNQLALRLPSKIYGILIVILFYLILNKALEKITKNPLLIAFFLSLILLSSRWFIHFVRISLEMPFLLFLELTSFYFAILYLDKKKLILLISSGICAGLAFNSYQPGRIFFLIPLTVLILNKIQWKNIVLFLTAFIVIISPMSFYLFTHPGNDIRIDQQLFLKNSELSLIKKAEFLGRNITSTSLMFFTKGDLNGHHNYPGKPALNPVLSLFFLMGFIITIINCKNIYNMIFLSYFFIALIPTILTYPWENPNMLRTYTVLPAIIYFVGQTIMFLLLRFKKYKLLNFLIALLLLFLSISSFYEMRTYFKYQPLVFKQAFDKPDYLKIIRKDTLKQK